MMGFAWGMAGLVFTPVYGWHRRYTHASCVEFAADFPAFRGLANYPSTQITSAMVLYGVVQTILIFSTSIGHLFEIKSQRLVSGASKKVSVLHVGT